jgi:hypothetical protein
MADSSKLKEFLNQNNSNKIGVSKSNTSEHNNIVSQLSSISWQLKRIADVLERKEEDNE